MFKQIAGLTQLVMKHGLILIDEIIFKSLSSSSLFYCYLRCSLCTQGASYCWNTCRLFAATSTAKHPAWSSTAAVDLRGKAAAGPRSLAVTVVISLESVRQAKTRFL